MVRLCRMKVWRPSHRNFMQSSKTTTIRANSSRVAWTCGQRVRGGGITGPPTHTPPPHPAHRRPRPTASSSEGGDGEWDCSSGGWAVPTRSHGAAPVPKWDDQGVPSPDCKSGQLHRETGGSVLTPRGAPRKAGGSLPLPRPPRTSSPGLCVTSGGCVSAPPECPLSGRREPPGGGGCRPLT